MGAESFVGEVFAAAYRRLVIQVYAVSGNVGDAEDAVQEAFVKALGRGRSFDAIQNPEAWLRTVALNHLRNRWRHAEVVRRFQGRLSQQPTHLELTPDHVALVEALSRLDRAHRTTVALYYLADLSVADVAAELAIPEGTVKTAGGQPVKTAFALVLAGLECGATARGRVATAIAETRR